MTKICSKCKIEKPIEAFSKDKNKKDGLSNQCKECNAKYRIEYRKNNKYKLKIDMAKYYKINKDNLKIRNKEYRKIHKDEIKVKHAEYYKNNRDKIHAKKAEYYKNNRDIINAKSVEHRKNVRLEVLTHYSNGAMQCKECGERHIEFLEMDHINGGGTKHRKTEDIRSMYYYLRTNKFPEGYQVLCSNCNNKKERLINREIVENGTKNQKQIYNHKFKLKLDIFSHYKTDNKIKCSCPNCNVDDIDVLCVDHINGDGAEHRKIVGRNMYNWVKLNNYPDTFRLLCYNCNQSLDHHGYCPHDIK